MKFRFGYVTIIILLAMVGTIGYQLYGIYKEKTQPPVILREVRSNSPKGKAPAPEFLQRHASELALTPAQMARLTAVAVAYRKDVALPKKQLDIATRAYEKYVEREKAGTRLSMQELEKHTADIQRYSSVVATTRHAYWQQARGILNPAQQRQTDSLVQQATLKDLL